MVRKGDFVHLHLHSQYSILDGAIKVKDLVKKAKELGMPAVAITDHGNMFASYELYKACKEEGIKPIIGQEFYIAKGSRFDRKKGGEGEKGSYHLILLAKNDKGLKNLMKLSTIGFTEGFYYKPRIDKEVLEKYSEGLIALSACIQGEVPLLYLMGKEEEARRAAQWYKELFGEDFYLELQYHGIPEQKKANEFLIKLAKELDIELVATNDAHYLNKEDWEAHDVLLCLQTGKKLSDEKRMRFPSREFYVKDAQEMLEVFKEVPQAVFNTLKIAEKVEERLETFENKGYLLPKYEVPEGHTYDSFLRKLAEEGLERRFKEQGITDGEKKQVYYERLNHELKIINDMGFPGYFLIVWDFINWAKRNGIPVGPGRGSAAGSLVAYAIGITDIDPIRFNLLFERFLNPERVTMPDIDVDICQDGRDRVIQYVREKYGEDKVCQIITFGTMKTKMVIRDVGRVLGIPPKEVDKLAKLIPDDAKSVEDAVERAPEIRELAEKDETIARLIKIAKRLQGLARQTGVHAAGVVIAPETLTDYIPLAKSKDGDITTQYDMGQVEALGLLKMDFLGLKTLTIIDRTIKLIKERHGVEIVPTKLPLDDPETFKLLQSGNTVGVFQLESRGMRNLMKRLKPSVFEDIIALVALYRPGPLNSGMAESYIRRKHGQEEVDYIFPELEPVLKETYGLFIYQEQIMQIANILAGYSLGEADLLRRAMGKKKKEIMEEQRSIFVSRAVERGYPREKIEKLFDDIAKFAEYGFNKSHSAAYGFLAYVTAYLKAHYPKELFATMMSIDFDKTDEIVKFIKDCKENGINVLPPDINRSGAYFEIEGEAIRFGLAGIKGVGEKAALHIEEVRKEGGEFKDLFDFCRRVDLKVVNRKVIEALIKAGAFDSTGINRASNLAALDRAMNAAQSIQKSQSKGLLSLFGEAESIVQVEFPEVEEWPERVKLEYERQAIGFYLSGHPLLEFKEIVTLAFDSTAEKEEWKDGQELTLAGAITDVKLRRTQRGDLWATVELTDLDGSTSVLVFPSVFKEAGEHLTEGNIVVVKGSVREEEESKSVIAKEIVPLNREIVDKITEVSIKLKGEEITEELLKELHTFIQNHSSPDGKPVVVEAELPDCFVKLQIDPSLRLPVEPQVLRELGKLIPKERIKVH
ncbi:DNA polymerase III subunit alpha [Thermovibrio ammonificans]|uniref:DNA polymerase III subunit alpha n=1 Tax=Thermovibrio ammonificans (strain DSM 15698 / JCM 12110 / HB-1) TaxID=648996 RepID=E8T4K5_THEA1|nr:DNA polymerase III subunit alpha [Thermovibrio ammonificans]ADU97463.1 DNA polymerase III, alpha subunit [Thermovibrio ammonificans HB-1]